ncbi:M23 family metallopeptidase [Bacillus sp. 1P02SD]|uniref:M23 family metallopeptidase n=1 Tax=Bacillus sp. 1P02SD TaxID=3132264 RepID=UPI0039A11B37
MKFKLTSGFGEVSPIRNWKPHTGIDLAMPENTTLRSIKEGVVDKVYTGESSLGKGIKINFNDGTQGIYGHMNEVKAKVGEYVSPGEVIGLSGNTGNSTGAHLHFALKENEQYVDPAPVAEQLAEISGNVSPGIITKLLSTSGGETLKEKAADVTTDIILGVLDALKDLLLGATLIGAGLLILLKVAGWRDGGRWAGVLIVANILIKFLFGMY